MQNVNIVIDAGVKFDEEFNEVIDRADRAEMAKYRNAIIDERKRRQNTWQKLKTERRRGDRKDLGMAVLYLILSGLMLFCAILDARRAIIYAGTERLILALFAFLFVILFIKNLGNAARYYLAYRGIEITIITPEQMRAEMAESAAAEAGTKYAALRKDSDEVLNAKQNQLDSLLGM